MVSVNISEESMENLNKISIFLYITEIRDHFVQCVLKIEGLDFRTIF